MGSKYWLTLDDLPTPHYALINCGLFQGLKELRLRNREELPFDPGLLEAPAPRSHQPHRLPA